MHKSVLHYIHCVLIPLYNATVFNKLCVILPCQFWLTRTWLWSEVHKIDVVGLLKQITKQSKAFPRERQQKTKVEIFMQSLRDIGNVFWINTHLQYASSIALAVSQRSARMEINDAALLENTNQSISDFVKSLLSLWPSGARQLHRFITVHCNVWRKKSAAQVFESNTSSRNWEKAGKQNTQKEMRTPWKDAHSALRTVSSLPAHTSQFCCCPALHQIFPHHLHLLFPVRNLLLSLPSQACQELLLHLHTSPGTPAGANTINMVGNTSPALSFRESLVRKKWDGGGTNLSLQADVGTRRFNLQREQTETAIILK